MTTLLINSNYWVNPSIVPPYLEKGRIAFQSKIDGAIWFNAHYLQNDKGVPIFVGIEELTYGELKIRNRYSVEYKTEEVSGWIFLGGITTVKSSLNNTNAGDFLVRVNWINPKENLPLAHQREAIRLVFKTSDDEVCFNGFFKYIRHKPYFFKIQETFKISSTTGEISVSEIHYVKYPIEQVSGWSFIGRIKMC